MVRPEKSRFLPFFGTFTTVEEKVSCLMSSSFQRHWFKSCTNRGVKGNLIGVMGRPQLQFIKSRPMTILALILRLLENQARYDSENFKFEFYVKFWVRNSGFKVSKGEIV